MRPGQAVYYAARARRLPYLKIAFTASYGPEEWTVRTVDHHGNEEEFDDVCHLRSTLHVWEEHAKKAAG